MGMTGAGGPTPRGILADPPAADGDRFDAIVIGGGILGASAALYLAHRGRRTLLLERDDFAAATSGASLRILHGGLRYLQSLDLGRSRESARARAWFLANFPDLCRPLPCLMPLSGRGLHRPALLGPALWLNDRISATADQAGAVPPGRLVPRGELARLVPGLPDAHPGRPYSGAALWHDGWIDHPARLVVEMLRWAAGLGAACHNYMPVTSVLVDRPGQAGARVTGVLVRDRRRGRDLTLSAPLVLNCAGPWVEAVVETAFGGHPEPSRSPLFAPSLAFNLVLDRPAPAGDAAHPMALAVSPPGGGSLFLLPWQGRLLAGTDHGPWTGPVAAATRPHPAPERVAAFLGRLNRALPSLALTTADVREVWAGFLPAAAPGSAVQSRRPLIHDHGREGQGPAGLVSLSAVKFTTAPLLAERAVAQLLGPAQAPLPRRRPAPQTIAAPPDAATFHQLLHHDPAAARQVVTRLIREEAVWTPADLTERRTDWAASPVHGRDLADQVADQLAHHLAHHPGAGLRPPDRTDKKGEETACGQA